MIATAEHHERVAKKLEDMGKVTGWSVELDRIVNRLDQIARRLSYGIDTVNADEITEALADVARYGKIAEGWLTGDV